MKSLIAELNLGNGLHRWFDIEEYHLNAYIRITKRYINGIFYDTLEIANVKVDEDYRNNGYFSMFLSEMESIALNFGRTIYIINWNVCYGNCN